MIALRLFYALAWADRSHLLSAVAKSSPTVNSVRGFAQKCSIRAHRQQYGRGRKSLAHALKASFVQSQCAPLLRKSRIQIIECRQDPR